MDNQENEIQVTIYSAICEAYFYQNYEKTKGLLNQDSVNLLSKNTGKIFPRTVGRHPAIQPLQSTLSPTSKEERNLKERKNE